jgi:alanyl-tRNA synthetase
MFGRLLLTALLAATMASAQRSGGGGGRNSGMGEGTGSSMMQRRQSKLELFAEKLKLSREQREETNSALAAAMEESAPARADMDKARVAYATALLDGKSADEVKKISDDYTSAAARMAAIEAKTFSKVYASLKPNQQSKAGQAFELLAEAFEQAAAGGGREGRERGRQGR